MKAYVIASLHKTSHEVPFFLLMSCFAGLHQTYVAPFNLSMCCI